MICSDFFFFLSSDFFKCDFLHPSTWLNSSGSVNSLLRYIVTVILGEESKHRFKVAYFSFANPTCLLDLQCITCFFLGSK